MKKTENTFDKLVSISKRNISVRNYFLFYGFMCMAISIVTHVTQNSRVALGTGVLGVIAGYIGVVMVILSDDNRSQKQKAAMIIIIPVVIALISQLYR